MRSYCLSVMVRTRTSPSSGTQPVTRWTWTSAFSWQAFTRFAIDGLSAADAAAELGLSVGAVIQAKSRVLKRLREQARDFLD